MQYETVFILTPVLSDAQMKEAVEKFAKVLTDNGASIVNTEEWGLRKLAYPIQKKSTGFYSLIEFEADPKKSTGFYSLIEFEADPQIIRKLEIAFRRDERVLRWLTFRQDKYAAQYAAKRRARRAAQPQAQTVETKED